MHVEKCLTLMNKILIDTERFIGRSLLVAVHLWVDLTVNCCSAFPGAEELY